MSGIYQPPTPPVGPDRQSDAYPLTPSADVAAARMFMAARAAAYLAYSGPEQFEGYDEWASAYEVFGEDL